MKNILTIIGVLLLITVLTVVCVLGVKTDGFNDWSFLDEQEDPNQSEEPPTDVVPDDGGNTGSSGGITSEPEKCEHVYTNTMKTKIDFYTMGNVFGYVQSFGADYRDGYSFCVDTVGFVMMTKDSNSGAFSPDKIKSWDFLYPTYNSNDEIESLRLLAHTDNGFENFSFKLSSYIEILNIALVEEETDNESYSSKTFFEITYKVDCYHCVLCGEGRYV